MSQTPNQAGRPPRPTELFPATNDNIITIYNADEHDTDKPRCCTKNKACCLVVLCIIIAIAVVIPVVLIKNNNSSSNTTASGSTTSAAAATQAPTAAPTYTTVINYTNPYGNYTNPPDYVEYTYQPVNTAAAVSTSTSGSTTATTVATSTTGSNTNTQQATAPIVQGGDSTNPDGSCTIGAYEGQCEWVSQPTHGPNDTPVKTVAYTGAQPTLLTGQADSQRSGFLSGASTYMSQAKIAAIQNMAATWTFNSANYAGSANAQHGTYQPSFLTEPFGVNGNIIVANDLNDVYLLNAATGSVVSHVYLGTPYNMTASNGAGVCGDELMIGVLSTPVINTQTNIVYMVSKTYEPQNCYTNACAVFYLHALNANTLAEQPNFPVLISNMQYEGATFHAGYQQNRVALLYMNNHIYIAFGSECDIDMYNGWIVSIDATAGTLDQVWANQMQYGGGGIWMASGGISTDNYQRIFVTTGNGNAPTESNTGGAMPQTQPNLNTLGNSAIRFDSSSLSVSQFYAPYYADASDQQDGDIGTSSITVLPSAFTTTAYPNVGMFCSKKGYCYVLDLNNMGGYQEGPSGTDAIIQTVAVSTKSCETCIDGAEIKASIATNPVDGYVYVCSDYMYALQYVEVNGVPNFVLVAASSDAMSAAVSAPIVVANGATANSAVVFVNTPPFIAAYYPIPNTVQHPVKTTLKTLPNVNNLFIGPTAAYAQPGFYNNAVYAGTSQGTVYRYG